MRRETMAIGTVTAMVIVVGAGLFAFLRASGNPMGISLAVAGFFAGITGIALWALVGEDVLLKGSVSRRRVGLVMSIVVALGAAYSGYFLAMGKGAHPVEIFLVVSLSGLMGGLTTLWVFDPTDLIRKISAAFVSVVCAAIIFFMTVGSGLVGAALLALIVGFVVWVLCTIMFDV